MAPSCKTTLKWLSVVNQSAEVVKSWGRDCYGLNPLTRASVTGFSGWMDLSSAVLMSLCSVSPCRQWHFTSRSLNARLSTKQSLVWIGVSLFAKLPLSCGCEYLSQQWAMIRAWKEARLPLPPPHLEILQVSQSTKAFTHLRNGDFCL